MTEQLKKADDLSVTDIKNDNRMVSYPNPVKRGNTLKLNTDYNADKIDIKNSKSTGTDYLE